MKRRLCALVAFLTLFAGAAFAQDARTVLQNAAKAMGAVNMKTIQYSGAGWDSSVGQSYNLTGDWPRFEVPAFMRVIDYDAKSWREERTRRQGNYPTYGRLPLQEEKITGSAKYGLGMRNSLPLTIAVKYALFAAGIAIYLSLTRAKDRDRILSVYNAL